LLLISISCSTVNFFKASRASPNASQVLAQHSGPDLGHLRHQLTRQVVFDLNFVEGFIGVASAKGGKMRDAHRE